MLNLRFLASVGAGSALVGAVPAQDHQMPVEHGNLMPSWSPDGKRIAFESDRDGDFDVYVMDANGANVRALTRNRVEDHLPRSSPDGKRIRFLSGPMEKFQDARYWFEIPVAGGRARPFRRNPAVADSSRSADGNVVAFTAPEPGPPGRHGGPQAVFVQVGAAVPRLISPPGQGEEPNVSPDGALVVFEHRRPNDDLNDSKLYLVAVATNEPAKVLTLGTNPSWSPDGQRLVFKSWDRKQQTLMITTIHRDGAGLRHLMPGVLPSWSRDGKRILFMTERTGQWEIMTVADDGTEARCLTCRSR